MLFNWIYDFSSWVGLATLIILEIVLGIDNLIFITILADKLPQFQRYKALIFGLLSAMLMRIASLVFISWVVTLKQPIFFVYNFNFSGRDIILVIGGLFLLFKGTMELHVRLEGPDDFDEKRKFIHPVFWQVIVQIVVLDAIFSLDSVITAVGMVQNLEVMVIAIVVSVLMMMAVSKPIIGFVSRHPTVVILCLGFLMMIGFSLIVEGFGFHIPKGYLYVGIGFSIIIEGFNQIARRNRERIIITSNLRAKTADTVLRLLGGKRVQQSSLNIKAETLEEQENNMQVFSEEEKDMIQGVLTLADRPAKSIMTPRTDIVWLDIDHSSKDLQRQILELGHSRFPVARGSLDTFIGVVSARDLLRDLLEHGKINPEQSIRQPLMVHESTSALKLMEQLRKSSQTVAMVLDEYGALEGMVTPANILEAIAGEFPGEDDEKLDIAAAEDGSLTVDGWIDVRHASKLFGINLVDEDDRYSTLAGFILWKLGHLPQEGEFFTEKYLKFEIVKLNGRNIDRVKVSRL